MADTVPHAPEAETAPVPAVLQVERRDYQELAPTGKAFYLKIIVTAKKASSASKTRTSTSD